MQDKTYRVCIVGFGGMGEWHFKHLPLSRQLVPVSACDLQESRLELARSYGLKTFNSMDEVLEDPDTDIVVIACPNQVHAEYAIAAMEAGKDVICEKPATMNARELEEILRVRDRTGRVFMVHQNRRWDSDYLTIRKVLAEKRLGKLYSIQSKVLGSRGVPKGWRQYKAYGGGMLLDWGVHLIDQIALAVDEPIRQVNAHFYHTAFSEVDDGFKSTFYYDSGLQAEIEVDTHAFVKEARWVLRGSEGSLVIPDWGQNARLIYARDKNVVWEEEILYTSAGPTRTMAPRTTYSQVEEEIPLVEKSWTAFYDNFAAVMEKREDMVVKSSESLYVMRLMEAITLSDAEKRRVGILFSL